ncbi:TPA: fimbrial protein [Klebsiella variicola]|uniref:fimbrial protein n=1 Tax=Klebsiella variicola TaxID=244366 RepID=UPI001CCD7693|nr:fimbrial protein [Klebsiella variicola]MBZ7593874.1 type 1 fimbrial protein [Klebsiella variicola]MCJ6066669.1 fimbrial protein [Klebsiella variicola]MCQ3872913.1 fimbrial protein [Klebsiella variicola]MCQ3912193.1 fimbrial protein [Klebsiella variicola]MDF7646374.1 fimbrial protein [Klebsiella variicola]
MKTQLRIMAILMGALVSGAAISGNTQPARSTMTVNPGASAGTQGTGGQVIFNGSITDSSCNVDSGSTGQTVDLGKWASNYFTSTGSETTKTSFHIKVKDCPASVTTVAVLFDGAREQTDTSLLAINSGGASGVAIKLYEHDQTTAVSLGKTTAKQAVTPGSSGSTGSADLEFYADYVSTGATVTAGDANGTANFNMIYN